jgi:1,4-alpha-glucan branching enzyme
VREAAGIAGYIYHSRAHRTAGARIFPTAATDRPISHAIATGLERIAAGRHHDPHELLGVHSGTGTTIVRAYLPATQEVRLADGQHLARLGQTDCFELQARGAIEPHPLLVWKDDRGRTHQRIDPYSFAPSLSAADLAQFAGGHHAEAWRMLGAHPATFDDIHGVRFAVWAPNVERVSLVGPFCDWDGRRLPMRVLGSSGVWELFVP